MPVAVGGQNADAVDDATQITVTTVNVTSWNTFKTVVQKAVPGTVYVVQEHKVGDAQVIAEEVDWLRSLGYWSYWEPARVTGVHASAVSGGVCVLASVDMGLRQIADVSPRSADDAGRLLHAVVDHDVLGSFAIVAVYLRVGVGLNEDNFATLGAAAAMLEQTGLEGMIVGDFNLGPQSLQISGVPRKAGLTVLAPTKPTCITSKSKSVIDYFVVADSLVRLVCEVVTVPCTAVAVHEPVRLSLGSRTAPARYLQLVSAPPLPKHLPFGPRPQPEDWRPVRAQLLRVHGQMLEVQAAQSKDHFVGYQWRDEVDDALEKAYQLVADTLEQEVAKFTGHTLTKTGTRGRAPRFAQRRLVLPKARARPWLSDVGPARWLLKRGQELAGTLRKTKPEVEDVHHLIFHARGCDLALREDAPVSVRDSPRACELRDQLADWCVALASDLEREGLTPEVGQLACRGLVGWIAEAERHIEGILALDKRGAVDRWKEFVSTSLAEGAGHLHKWTRAPEGQRPPVAKGDVQRGVSGLPVRVLEQECEKYEDL